MRSLVRLGLCSLAVLPFAAQASCFSIYNPQNVLIYQSTITPVDLSLLIADATRQRFPGSFLVMTPSEERCSELRTSGGTVRPRFDRLGRTPRSGLPPDQTLQASPLYTNTAPTQSSATSRGASENDPLLRGAARSGPSSNLKR